MLLAFAVALGNGVLSFAAPSMLALLPAFLCVLARGSDTSPPRRAGIVVMTSAGYVAGSVAVYAALGALAGSSGRTLRLGVTVGERAGGALVISVALILLIEARTAWLTRLTAPAAYRAAGPALRGWAASWVMGVVFAATSAVCAGPPLTTALALAANTSDAMSGGMLLLAYAIGLSVPFALAALAVAGSERFRQGLGARSAVILRIGFLVLAVLGLLMVSGRYDVVARWDGAALLSRL